MNEKQKSHLTLKLASRTAAHSAATHTNSATTTTATTAAAKRVRRRQPVQRTVEAAGANVRLASADQQRRAVGARGRQV